MHSPCNAMMTTTLESQRCTVSIENDSFNNNISEELYLHQLSEPESLSSSSFPLFSDSGESEQDLLFIIVAIVDGGKGV